MHDYGDDIFTEPEDVDHDTLANLGPLRRMAGVWRGEHGVDVNPKADGPETQAFIEHMEMHPIDPQANGPQLYYGLRYHTRIVKPGEVETYHDQIGYWLWEPVTGTILQTLAIPRGQTALAMGKTTAQASTFEVSAERGSTQNGISSNPFLEDAFRTLEYRIVVTVEGDDQWSYDEDTVMMVRGRKEPFHHTDRATLKRIGPPVLNPLMRGR
jgi:hypothetical protein